MPVLKRLITQIKHLINPPRKPLIIVGVEYSSYQIHNAIKSGKKYYTAFFIDEEPWSHRNYIDEAQLRYPVELRALCLNYDVKGVICVNNKDKERMQNIKDRAGRNLVSPMMVFSPEDVENSDNIDQLISSHIGSA